MIFMRFVSFRWLSLLVYESTFWAIMEYFTRRHKRRGVGGRAAAHPGLKIIRAISVFRASASC